MWAFFGAGMRVGDRITAIDRIDVSADRAYLFYALSGVDPGSRVQLGLADGRVIELQTAN